MNVGIVYRPPNSNFNDFLTELRSIIKTLPKTVTYLMGDFNLDLHKNESSSNVAAFEQFFISEGHVTRLMFYFLLLKCLIDN